MSVSCDQCRKLDSELRELKKSYRNIKASYLAATKTISDMMEASRVRYPEMTTEIVCLKNQLENIKRRMAE